MKDVICKGWVCVVLLFTGCSRAPGVLVPPYTVLKSQLPRATVTLGDAGGLVSDVVHGQEELALSLLARISQDQPGANVMISPESLSLALAMLLAGTEGDTETAMAQSLHFPGPLADFESTMNAIDLSLSARAGASSGFDLTSQSAVWTDRTIRPLPGYLDSLATNYGTGVLQMDFNGDPEGSRSAVNDWISSVSQGLIPELFGPGSVDSTTLLLLSNAIYLHAQWKAPFEARMSRLASFFNGQATSQVETLAQTGVFPYYEDSTLQAIELPYANEDFGMVILLPKTEGTPPSFSSAVAGLENETVYLELPKFHFEGGGDDILGYLEAMGMPTGPFAAMFAEPLVDQARLRNLLQKTWISVDELGTQAAAATGAGIGATSMPEPAPASVEMRVDHPFYFAIRDRVTGVALFLGQVFQP